MSDQMYQLFTGGADFSEGVHAHGVPGSSLFRTDNPDLPNFATQSAFVIFPAGRIRNLRISVFYHATILSGKIEARIHSTGITGNSQGSKVVARLTGIGEATSGDEFLDVADGDKISIKVANTLVSDTKTSVVGFTYSFEFYPLIQHSFEK